MQVLYSFLRSVQCSSCIFVTFINLRHCWFVTFINLRHCWFVTFSYRWFIATCYSLARGNVTSCFYLNDIKTRVNLIFSSLGRVWISCFRSLFYKFPNTFKLFSFFLSSLCGLVGSMLPMLQLWTDWLLFNLSG
jgi:hypothetical protein